MKIDEVIRSKRKSIALEVTADARLVVRSPLQAPLEYIEWLVQKKKSWIRDKQQIARKRNSVHAKKKFVEGEGFLYLGKFYKLSVIPDGESVSLSGNTIRMPASSMVQPEAVITELYRKEAAKIFKERADWLCNLFGFAYRSIKITDAKKRWGSCGPNNRINLTWRLVMAPVRVVDYVVLHELVHTQVKNHGTDFWAKVRVAMPDYQIHKRWLEENQRVLDL